MQYHTVKNESLLVQNLSKGNLLAFNTLYNEYSGRLYRFALGYLKSEAEAEELVQEVFTKIWEKRADLFALVKSDLPPAVRESARADLLERHVRDVGEQECRCAEAPMLIQATPGPRH